MRHQLEYTDACLSRSRLPDHDAGRRGARSQPPRSNDQGTAAWIGQRRIAGGGSRPSHGRDSTGRPQPTRRSAQAIKASMQAAAGAEPRARCARAGEVHRRAAVGRPPVGCRRCVAQRGDDHGRRRTPTSTSSGSRRTRMPKRWRRRSASGPTSSTRRPPIRFHTMFVPNDPLYAGDASGTCR